MKKKPTRQTPHSARVVSLAFGQALDSENTVFPRPLQQLQDTYCQLLLNPVDNQSVIGLDNPDTGNNQIRNGESSYGSISAAQSAEDAGSPSDTFLDTNANKSQSVNSEQALNSEETDAEAEIVITTFPLSSTAPATTSTVSEETSSTSDTTTTTATIVFTQGQGENSNNHTPPTTDSGDTTDMGERSRLEEKMWQFQISSNSNREDNEEHRGSLGSVHMSELEKQRRRNLIFDEERFEDTFLKCLICREVYNETDKLPKMLHCHHTFCLDCLCQMHRVEGEFRQSLTSVFRGMPMAVKIQCPTCREGIIISEPELRRLPNDHTIMELLCFVSQTGKNEVQYCTKHQMQPLNFFCEPCILPVCCDCTVIDHKESKGHVVVNVEEAMKKYTPIVEETLSDIKIEKSSLAEKRFAVEHAQDDLDQIQKDLNYQIREVFDNIRRVLDERERELYDVSEAEINKKREVLNGHMQLLAERESQLNIEFNELQRAKDDKDISQIFTGHKSARDVLSRKVNVPTNSTKGFSVTFQFSSRCDSVIKQQVANLGDIIFHS